MGYFRTKKTTHPRNSLTLQLRTSLQAEKMLTTVHTKPQVRDRSEKRLKFFMAQHPSQEAHLSALYSLAFDSPHVLIDLPN